MIPAKLPAAHAGANSSGNAPQETRHEAWRTAWQKEMERLQASAWLGHSLVGGLDALDSPKPKAADEQSTDAVPQADKGQQVAAARQPVAVLQLPWGRRLGVDPGLGTRDGGRALPGKQVAFDLSHGAQPPGPTQTAAMDALVRDLQTALPGLEIQASARSVGVQVAEQTPPSGISVAPMAARHGPANARIQGEQGGAKSQEAGAGSEASSALRADREALRLHAEWTDAGVRLWLGMDAVAAIPAARLLLQLQRSLGACGCRLLSLTCNGHPVPLDSDGFPSSKFFKEMEGSSWPSAQ